MGRGKGTTATVHGLFQETLDKTALLIDEVMREGGWSNARRAYLALKVTLHALRDRLPVDEAAQLGAQLPLLVKGIYYEEWDPSNKPLKERHLAGFLAHVGKDLRHDPEMDPERAVRAVFAVLARHVTPGEVMDVMLSLPRDLRDLWPRLPEAV